LRLLPPVPLHSIKINQKPKPIWRKEKSSRAWALLFFLVTSLLIVLAAMAEASPPRSRGARPISLGNGYSANSGDVYSLFYNPAGLYHLNQEQMAIDYGRSHSENEIARSDFNGIFAMPWKWKEHYLPLAVGFYGEQAAPGAHIIDVTVGGAIRAPVDRWSKGLIKLPATGGLALTVRHQNGEDRSDRVGDSTIALGLTGGFHFRIDRQHDLGVAVRHLYAGDGDARGPSIHVGVLRRHRTDLTILADLEYSKGGIFRFQPGIEWAFYRGMVRPRLGWGFRDNRGVDTIATGIGFNLSPLQIDIAYLIPVKTLSDNAGQIRTSLVYRFGTPQFTEIYFDRALEAASKLDITVLELTVKEAELKSSLAELEQKMRMTTEELKSSKNRVEALKKKDLLGQRDAEIRRLKEKIRILEGRLSSQRSQNKTLKKKRATIRTHMVKSSDTLQSIAEKYYGDPNQWKKIYNSNADKIDRGLPRVGANLVIP